MSAQRLILHKHSSHYASLFEAWVDFSITISAFNATLFLFYGNTFVKAFVKLAQITHHKMLYYIISCSYFFLQQVIGTRRHHHIACTANLLVTLKKKMKESCLEYSQLHFGHLDIGIVFALHDVFCLQVVFMSRVIIDRLS